MLYKTNSGLVALLSLLLLFSALRSLHFNLCLLALTPFLGKQLCGLRQAILLQALILQQPLLSKYELYKRFVCGLQAPVSSMHFAS